MFLKAQIRWHDNSRTTRSRTWALALTVSVPNWAGLQTHNLSKLCLESDLRSFVFSGLRLRWLADSCTQTADVVSRQHLRSASQRTMIVPRYRLDSYGRRCFAVAGPLTWNSLPDSLRDPALSLSIFSRQLKTHILRNTDETYLALYKLTRNLLPFMATKI